MGCPRRRGKGRVRESAGRVRRRRSCGESVSDWVMRGRKRGGVDKGKDGEKGKGRGYKRTYKGGDQKEKSSAKDVG